MAQNGISTEVVYIGTSTIVDPIATKVQRRSDKLALAQQTRQFTTYGFRIENQITSCHSAYVNGSNGPVLTTLSGTASPTVGHPWSITPSIDIIVLAGSELDTTPTSQVAGVTYVSDAVIFITNGVITDPNYGSTGFDLLNFTTSTSVSLNTMLGNVSTATSHVGFYYAQWSAGSTSPNSFVFLVHFDNTPTGNNDGTGIYFEITDGNGSDIPGTWIFPVTLTLAEQLA